MTFATPTQLVCTIICIYDGLSLAYDLCYTNSAGLYNHLYL